MTVFYEDLSVGEVDEFGEYEVTEEEILEFAARYDPQFFHVDPERAREESVYGGLIASGWHTCAMTMRMLVDGHFSDAASLGARGLEGVRWRRPVRPGDVLSVRIEVVGKESDAPDRGDVTIRTETLDADGEVVMRMTSVVMYRKRGDETGAE